jgi:hypothetical protein
MEGHKAVLTAVIATLVTIAIIKAVATNFPTLPLVPTIASYV